jgi:glycerol uptake facilitator-like aquaporin
MTPRALVSEALGTALLVATVIGSAIMAQALTQDVGVLLLANALVTGSMLFVLITILGPLSGAHFNPLVTLIMAARRDLPWGAVLPYLMAQIVGALVGMVLTHGMFDMPLIQISTHVRGGQGQVLAEAVATFGLIFTIFGGIHARANVPALVGGYITAAYWFTSSTSFANPIMLLARSRTNTPSGLIPAAAPSVLAAEVVGGVLAAVLAGWLFRKEV